MTAWRQQTFRALAHRHYRRYWVSQLFSLVGSWMQVTAQSYLVLELTGNNSAALGWVTVAQFTPSLLLSLFAGAVIDRAPRRTILLTTQVTLMLTALVLAVSTNLGVVSLPLVLAIAFFSGIANAFDMPARQSMVADFVPRGDVPNAVALNSLSFNVSRTLGQAIFGGVAAAGAALLGHSGSVRGLAFPFYLNVASFVVVIAVLATLPFPLRERGVRPPVLDDIKVGLRYVRATPTIRYTLMLVGLLSLTIINFNVIIPYYARAVFGLQEAGFGLMNASFGVGAMAGALWQASRPNPLRNMRWGSVLLLLCGLLLAAAPTALLAGLVLALCGFSMLMFTVSANSSVQLTVPDALRGRVMSLYSLVLVGMGPPGALLVSHLIAKSGTLGPRWGLSVIVALGSLSLAALWSHIPRALPKRADSETPVRVEPSGGKSV